MAQHPHIVVSTTAEPRRFTSPHSGPRGGITLPPRDRAAHAQSLIAKLEDLSPAATVRVEAQMAHGIDAGLGIYLTFDSEPNFPLKFESLNLANSGIELCIVKTLADTRTQATVFVPDGALKVFLNKIAAYSDENTTPRREGGTSRPKNQDLVESISDIRLAALEAMWTEETLPFPDRNVVITWEVWLRRDPDLDHLTRLRRYAEQFNLSVGEQTITFIDRAVVLVRGTGNDLSRSTEVLGMIAELRLPKTTAGFFVGLALARDMAPDRNQVFFSGKRPDDFRPTLAISVACATDNILYLKFLAEARIERHCAHGHFAAQTAKLFNVSKELTTDGLLVCFRKTFDFSNGFI